VPKLDVLTTMRQLALLTVAPVGLGMLIRALSPNAASRMTVWLRPASVVVLVAVIAFSAWVSAKLVFDNLLHAGPASFVLNALGMGTGVLIARLLRLDRADTLTVAIEVGIHNATMATFLTLSILKDIALAITPTIYGAIMVINAGLLVQIFRAYYARRAAPVSVEPAKAGAEATP
jgi:BASS family bile acid:Na+ symporter